MAWQLIPFLTYFLEETSTGILIDTRALQDFLSSAFAVSVINGFLSQQISKFISGSSGGVKKRNATMFTKIAN